MSLDRFEDVVSQLTDETVSDKTKVSLLKSLREKQPATQVIQVRLTRDNMILLTLIIKKRIERKSSSL